jgi:hypothetical protein
MELWRKRNTSTYIVVPLVDADGDPVSQATTLDSEYLHWSDTSVPCAFSDLSDEARSVADGVYVLGLAAAELAWPYVYIEIKSADIKAQQILIRTTVNDPLDWAPGSDNISIMSAIAHVQIDTTSAAIGIASVLSNIGIMSSSVMRDVTSIVVGVTSMMISVKSALSNTIAINTAVLSAAVSIKSTWSNTIAIGVQASSLLSNVNAVLGNQTSHMVASYSALSNTAALLLYGASAAINILSLGVNVRSMASHFADMSEDDGGVWRYTANALEQAPSGTGASAAVIADAVWQEYMSQMSAVGTAGALLWSAATTAAGAGESGDSIASAVWGHTTALSMIVAVKSTLSNTIAINTGVLSAAVATKSAWSNTMAILVSTSSLLSNVTNVDSDLGTVAGNVTTILAGTTSIAINVSSLLSNITNVDSDLATVAGNVATILVDTTSAAIGLASLLSNIAAVNVLVTSVLVDTSTSIPASIAALNNLSAAQVNAEVVDALTVDTYAEPAQGAPGATISLAQKIGYLFKGWRNRKTVTSTAISIYNDDAVTVDQKAVHSDDGNVYDKGETGSGP